MMIEWTKLAKNDLEHIYQYIKKDNQQAAVTVMVTIRKAIHGQLATSAFSGRVGRVKETRELIVPHLPYLVVYRVIDSAIQVLRVLHEAQRWPRQL